MTDIHKASIIDLAPMLNLKVRVKLAGGREVSGVLKSYDKIPNIVLEDTKEYRDKGDRELGIVILRGPLITCIMPDSLTAIENPF
jgi:U6 snRNA-associated Sm-like protein LSm7